MGDTPSGEGTQLLWFSSWIQSLLWHEVLVDTLLEEREGAFLVLEGAVLRGHCCFLGHVFGFFTRTGPVPFNPLLAAALVALDHLGA